MATSPGINAAMDKALTDITAKLHVLMPDDPTWLMLPYSDGEGRHYASLYSIAYRVVILINDVGQFRVWDRTVGTEMPWHNLTKQLCGVSNSAFVLEDMWYTVGEP